MPSSDITLSSLDATNQQAIALARTLSGGQIIAFSGELGAGKTTFIRFLCSALGAQVDASSPSYVLQHEYKTASKLLIEHWDLYRLKELPPELEEDPSPSTLRIIEWAERFPELLSRANIRIELKLDTENSRRMKLTTKPKST